jgi:hypothetical protein
MIIDWLTTRVALYICGALLLSIVALGIALWVQSIELRSCRADVKMKQADVARLEDEKTRLIGLLKEQNEAVERLKADGKERAAAAEKALQAASEASARYEASRKRIAALLATPSQPGNGCKEAVNVVRQELKK